MNFEPKCQNVMFFWGTWFSTPMGCDSGSKSFQQPHLQLYRTKPLSPGTPFFFSHSKARSETLRALQTQRRARCWAQMQPRTTSLLRTSGGTLAEPNKVCCDLSGWWFQPIPNLVVNWDHHPRYNWQYETTNQEYIFWRGFLYLSTASALSKKIGKMRSLRVLFPLLPYWNLKFHRLSSRESAWQLGESAK